MLPPQSPWLRRTARRGTSLALAALVAMAAVFSVIAGTAGPASAHTGDQSYLYLDVTDVSLSGRVEVPIPDMRTVLELTLEGTDEAVQAELDANVELLHQFLDDHVDIGPEGADWDVEFDGVSLFFSDLEEINDNYVVIPFTVDVDSATDPGAVPRNFDVRFDPFFDELPDRNALLLIGNDWKAGVIENGSSELLDYNTDNRLQTVDLGETGWFKTFMSSARLGMNHIKTGPDHILFVLVLLLPSVLVFTNRWQPAASFGSALWRVLKIVTMFTVAHSITFTLAGLDILPLPSPRIIESIIAISIAAAALHNIRPIAANKEWLISFAFGLFHGMGFASLVSGLDVDRGTQLVSLLGRNLGIEIGQAIVVLVLFPALFLFRRTRFYQPFLIGASVLLAIVSVGWMIERLFETELGVSDLVDPIVAWPQVLIYVGVLTAIAFALERTERNNDRLLPVAGGEDEATAASADTAGVS